MSGKQRIASHALKEKKRKRDDSNEKREKPMKARKNWVERIEEFMSLLKKAAFKLKENLNLDDLFMKNVKEVVFFIANSTNNRLKVFFSVIEQWKTSSEPIKSGFIDQKAVFHS